MYLGFEGARVPSSEVARKGRAFEIGLIDRLAGSSDPAGTIGIQARSSLQRIPSSIYWNGLKLLRICLFPGSQTEYHRGLDRQNAAGATVRRNDVVEVDGAQHLADPVAYRRDRRKDRLLQENGYLVLRYLAEDLGQGTRFGARRNSAGVERPAEGDFGSDDSHGRDSAAPRLTD